ncbi:MAG: hypothetical protein GYA55_10250 [SAR324 cluster bacterium]|uniref:Uncharacterized protein n=1 Tax=SAR324 cluster bacterium TaxID=2024889 RepID=A0A7X9FSJ5_9DELT|nr:hypothetical protein [SAR324 cluster bacterium]
MKLTCKAQETLGLCLKAFLLLCATAFFALFIFEGRQIASAAGDVGEANEGDGYGGYGQMCTYTPPSQHRCDQEDVKICECNKSKLRVRLDQIRDRISEVDSLLISKRAEYDSWSQLYVQQSKAYDEFININPVVATGKSIILFGAAVYLPASKVVKEIKALRPIFEFKCLLNPRDKACVIAGHIWDKVKTFAASGQARGEFLKGSVKDGLTVCGSTAVAFYFGDELQRCLNIDEALKEIQTNLDITYSRQLSLSAELKELRRRKNALLSEAAAIRKQLLVACCPVSQDGGYGYTA